MTIFDDTPNELEPIVLPDGEADKFVRDRVCAGCLGYLGLKPTGDRRWFVHCAMCKVNIIDGGHVHESNVERNEHKVREGLRELRPDKPRRSEAEILAELGF